MIVSKEIFIFIDYNLLMSEKSFRKSWKNVRKLLHLYVYISVKKYYQTATDSHGTANFLQNTIRTTIIIHGPRYFYNHGLCNTIIIFDT